MSSRVRILLIALGCLVVLAAGEQTGLGNIYFSKSISGTGLDVARQPLADELDSSIEVRRPFTRWLPLVKFGETVHRRTYHDRKENGAIFRHVVTTRTSMWVVGLCSTARYDELANKPFEESRKRYQAKR